MVFQYEVEIDKPVSEVYRAFNNPDNMPRWLTGFQRFEPISGEPGRPGSTARHVYLERGRTVELIETITLHEPEKRFEGRLEGQGVNCAMQVEFVDKGDTTIVRARSDFRSRSFLMSLMLPFVGKGIRERQGSDLRRFKELIEAGKIAG